MKKTLLSGLLACTLLASTTGAAFAADARDGAGASFIEHGWIDVCAVLRNADFRIGLRRMVCGATPAEGGCCCIHTAERSLAGRHRRRVPVGRALDHAADSGWCRHIGRYLIGCGDPVWRQACCGKRVVVQSFPERSSGARRAVLAASLCCCECYELECRGWSMHKLPCAFLPSCRRTSHYTGICWQE